MDRPRQGVSEYLQILALSIVDFHACLDNNIEGEVLEELSREVVFCIFELLFVEVTNQRFNLVIFPVFI